VSSRYERSSVIVTSNTPFGRSGEVIGDATVAVAMIDRLVQHVTVVKSEGRAPTGSRTRDLGRVPTYDRG
jgi:DNA replication protein DnaC